MTKVVLLEFNELTPHLIQKFIASGQLPEFSKLYAESKVFVTDAEEEGETLNPWVQWVSAHCGASADKHGAKRLDDARKVPYPAVWETLSQNDYKVWVCGSMNAWYKQSLKGFLLPDPWTSSTQSYPKAEFDDYYEFVKSQVHGYFNPNQKSRMLAAVKFVWFLVKNGLTLSSVFMIVRQLLGEKFGLPSWRRAAILDSLQCDLFLRRYKKLRPDFSTLFLNSTAHYQHHYWRYMEPEVFGGEKTENSKNKHAILFGYQAMDRLIGRIRRAVGTDATIILATGLSAQPSSSGKVIYGLRQIEDFLGARGVSSNPRVEPVMSGHFWLHFDSKAACNQAEKKLSKLKLADSRKVFDFDKKDASLFVFSQFSTAISTGTKVLDSGEVIGNYEDFFYQFGEAKSGKHHPDGMLWIAEPNGVHKVVPDKVPIRALAPTLLKLFSVRPASYMPEPVL